MLFTRCPECETTFRVTDETLKKAHGQVRCGRCATVFNAYAELRDPNAKSFDRPEPTPPLRPLQPEAPPDATASAGSGGAAEPSPPPTSARAPEAAASLVAPAPPLPAAPVAENAVVASLGSDSVADIVAQVETGAAVESATEAAIPLAAPPAGEDDDTGRPISPREVDAVLTAPVVGPAESASWPVVGAATDGSPRRSGRWGTAAACALLLLGAQVLHHYRTEIAGDPTFGPWLQGAYGVFGVEVRPRWDVHQYEILDWVATAEPNARGLGSLKITAHIQNRGAVRQPYPAVQLKLKDRWEEAVSSRMFTPAEYLPSETPRDRMMSPGETTRAEIEVVDPGPDAYGFELDVCIEVEASLVSCGTDEVFL